MTRVIAVQDGQLNMLKDNYVKNVPINAIVNDPAMSNPAPIFNNADVLSGSLEVPPMEQTPTIPATPQIDMENQSVNLNPFGINPVVEQAPISSVATNEVFGPQLENDQSLNGNNKDFDMNLNVTPVNTVNNDLPYQEPVMNNTTTNTTGNDEFYNDYIKDLNALRDKLTASYNDALAEIDKLQEKLNQKTGAQLLNTYEKAIQTSGEVNNQINNTSSENIFDADKTFVTNDFRQEIANARNEMEQGMPRVV